MASSLESSRAVARVGALWLVPSPLGGDGACADRAPPLVSGTWVDYAGGEYADGELSFWRSVPIDGDSAVEHHDDDVKVDDEPLMEPERRD